MVGKIISINNNKIEIILTEKDIQVGNVLCLSNNEGKKFIVTSITSTSAVSAVLDDITNVKKGDEVNKLDDELMVEYSNKPFGHIVDYKLDSIDNNDFKSSKKRSIKNDPLPMGEINTESYPLWTGIKAVDFFSPINYGDRVGIVGINNGKKTNLINKLIKNIYKVSNPYNIYVGIGKKYNEIIGLYEDIKDESVFDNTCIISSNTTEVASKKVYSLYAGVTLAEFIRDERKKDAIVYIDDVNNFLTSYKQIDEKVNDMSLKNIEDRLASSRESNVTIFESINDELDSHISTLDACIYMDNNVIDIYRTFSNKLDTNNIEERHNILIKEVLSCLNRKKELDDVVNILGIDALSNEDKNIINNAKEIEDYFKDYEIEDYTEIDTLLDDVERILKGNVYGNF